ncbi:tripartite tricarboxylate transporter TctB family protein [Pseudochelatococcus sp. B33]
MNATLFRKPDFWFGAIGICLSSFLFAQTRNLSAGAVSDAVGSAFFPRLLIGLLFVLCVLLIIRARNAVHMDVEHGSMGRALVTVLLIAVYCLAMPYAGYYPSTIVLLAGILWIAGMRRLTSIAFVVAVLVAFQFFVFDRLFGVLFPTSSLIG